MMKRYLVALALALSFSPALAQGPMQCNVSVADPTYQAGQNRPCSLDTSGHIRTTSTVVANFAGFNPLTTGTPIAVTTGGVTGNMPAGAVVVASNVGTANVAYCKLGAATTVNDQPIMPGGWFAYTVGVATQLTCITSTSTTTVNMVGGSGLPTGVGGSASSSGGSSVDITAVGGNAVTTTVPVSGTVTATGPLTDAQLRAVAVPVSGTVTATGPLTDAQLRATPVPISGALTANQSVNVAQINGVTPLMGAGNTGTGSPRVTVSTDQAAIAAAGQGATGAAVPAGAQYGGVNVGGNLTGLIGDRCQVTARTYLPVNIATATTTRIIAPSASNRTYICGMFLIAAGTQNVGIVEGTGGTCGTGTAGVIGGTTAATGPNLTAQAGFVLPNTGYAQAATAGTNVDFCLITSAAVQLTGHVVYVQAP